MAHTSDTRAVGDAGVYFHNRNLQVAIRLEREHLCSLGYFHTHYHLSMLQLITTDKAGAVVTCGFCTAFGSDKLCSCKGGPIDETFQGGQEAESCWKSHAAIHAGCDGGSLACHQPCLWDEVEGTPCFSPVLSGQRGRCLSAEAGVCQKQGTQRNFNPTKRSVAQIALLMGTGRMNTQSPLFSLQQCPSMCQMCLP